MGDQLSLIFGLFNIDCVKRSHYIPTRESSFAPKIPPVYFIEITDAQVTPCAIFTTLLAFFLFWLQACSASA